MPPSSRAGCRARRRARRPSSRLQPSRASLRGWRADATRGDSIAAVKALLLGVPASNPTVAAELMLGRKRIEVDRFDLVPGLHRVVLRRVFPDGTVPALFLDGRRLQGTRTISRAL